jgi:hypothetical protein
MPELSELLGRFRRGPELLATALTGAAGAELDYSPGPGKWSPRQIAAHLADAELVGSTRLRFVISEENPALVWFDQDAWAGRLGYERRKTSDSMESFRRLRAENYELLKDLPEAAFQRAGMHTQRGRMTLLELLEGYTQHAESHAQQIRAARDAYRAAKQRSAGGQA